MSLSAVHDTHSATPYRLSFLVGGLLSTDAAVAAPIYIRTGDWTTVRSELVDGNLLATRTKSSAVRLSRELAQRMACLSSSEVAFVVDASGPDRAQLMWAAMCRRYLLVAEFAEDVLRDRFLLGVGTVNADDFDRFLVAKSLWHPELGDLKPSTQTKLRTNLFLALRQAGMLEKGGAIIPPLLSPTVLGFLNEKTPSEIRFFPTLGGLQ